MNFQELHSRLVAKGYTDDTADAKIAHDIVLKAINAASFRDNLTIKGGVVMSGITDLIRRATMDMDVDFLHYSISNASVRHFVAILNRASDCRIQIVGPIMDLNHQDYRGKRLFLKTTDTQKVNVKYQNLTLANTLSPTFRPQASREKPFQIAVSSFSRQLSYLQHTALPNENLTREIPDYPQLQFGAEGQTFRAKFKANLRILPPAYRSPNWTIRSL